MKRAFYAALIVLLWIAAAPLRLPAAAKEPSKPTKEECLACHSDASLTKEVDGKQVSLQVKEDGFNNSIHGAAFTCVDCHVDVKESPHTNSPAKISCAQCHADAVHAYQSGFHAKTLEKGGTTAARCADCH